MNDQGHHGVTEPTPLPGVGGDAGTGYTARQRSAFATTRNSGDFAGRELFACPHCGHQLRMFKEARSSLADKIAAQIATVTGSWPFLLFLVVAIIAWFVLNAIVRLVDPHPSAMLDYLGTALAIVAALQGPLILLTQRRESDRDRMRDIETFHISQNTEADLHAISQAINAALDQRERSMPPVVSDPPGNDRASEDPEREPPPGGGYSRDS